MDSLGFMKSKNRVSVFKSTSNMPIIEMNVEKRSHEEEGFGCEQRLQVHTGSSMEEVLR